MVLEKKRKKRERERKKVLQEIKGVLRELLGYFEKAYIFGSITKPYRWNEWSDIDVGLFGLSNKDWFSVFCKLSERVEREIDVLHLEGHRLRKKVMEEGVLIGGKNGKGEICSVKGRNKVPDGCSRGRIWGDREED